MLHLHLCIWHTLLSKTNYIAFQGTHLHSVVVFPKHIISTMWRKLQPGPQK